MKLATVQAWHEAIDSGDAVRLRQTAASDVAIVGPRGVAQGQAVLEQWALSSGARFTPLRWFCGSLGDVVVAQAATWPDDGGRTEPVELATHFRVVNGQITRIERHENLKRALDAAALSSTDEVSAT